MPTLESAWLAWAAAAIPPEALVSQRIAMRTAFYSGAATLLSIVLDAPDTDEEVVPRLHRELHDFVRGLSEMEQRKTSRLV